MYNNSNLVPKNVITPSTSSEPMAFNILTSSDEPRSIEHRALEPRCLNHIRILPPANSSNADIFATNVGNRSKNFTGSGNNSNLLQSITDFSIAVDGNNQYRPMVVYNPAAEYRLIDMHSSMNLNRIDIIVYWKDTFGNIHPFELHPGCAANVKILFRRKDFNTTT